MKKGYLKAESNFFAGPRNRWQELKYAFGSVTQFIKGFRALHFAGPCVTVFGSARFAEDHPHYIMARNVAAKISKLGFTIMTGGGPGIMEAANRGAKDVDGLSIGCNIVLPKEQQPNPFLDKSIDIEYFFVRKELLRKYSVAFIVLPGGFGTLDEFFETITLIQNKKIEHFPIVVMGLDFHQHLREHIDEMIKMKTISLEDAELILFTDDPEEVAMHVWKHTKPVLHHHKARKPSWVLGEKHIRNNQN